MTIDDLNVDFLREYLAQTSDWEITDTLGKIQMAKSLGLLDENVGIEEESLKIKKKLWIQNIPLVQNIK